MPELPEVETTCRGIAPHLEGQRVTAVTVHDPRLRWPVPESLQAMVGENITAIDRRAKYILMQTRAGTAIVHLGMSGSLRICAGELPRRKHDHVEWWLDSGCVMRLHDPRRFGAVLWHGCGQALPKPLLHLGPEPLGNAFSGEYLFATTRKRKSSIKQHLMNNHIVVGVGNIYANEALFQAGIRPGRAAGRLSRAEAEALADAVRDVLQRAIREGGTTLRDYLNSDGEPGYFAQSLWVYARDGQPCRRCATPIRRKMIGQRSSYYCPLCQS